MLGVCERTFRRYVDRYEDEGLDGLLDKRLGQVSARRAPVDEVVRTEALYRERYDGWTVAHFYSFYRRRHAGERSYTWVKNTLQRAGLVAPPTSGTHRLPARRWPSRWGIITRSETQQPLASQDPDNTYIPGFAPIHHPERRMDQLPQEPLSEFRHDSAHIRVRSQRFQPLEDLLNQSIPDIGNALFRVPFPELFEIRHRGFREADRGSWHGLLQTQSFLRFGERDLSSGFEISEPGHDRPHEDALLLGRLVVGHRLHHGHCATTTRQEHRSAGLCRVLDNPSRIDLEVRERHNVLGKSDTHGLRRHVHQVVPV